VPPLRSGKATVSMTDSNGEKAGQQYEPSERYRKNVGVASVGKPAMAENAAIRKQLNQRTCKSRCQRCDGDAEKRLGERSVPDGTKGQTHVPQPGWCSRNVSRFRLGAGRYLGIGGDAVRAFERSVIVIHQHFPRAAVRNLAHFTHIVVAHIQAFV
jgi:hypothetical protein